MKLSGFIRKLVLIFRIEGNDETVMINETKRIGGNETVRGNKTKRMTTVRINENERISGNDETIKTLRRRCKNY